MLTRRVRGRVLLLKPTRKTKQLVGYVLANMAAKWRIRVVAVTVLSNHWHVVLMDDHGYIVDFQRDCHSFIARGLNAGHGEFEAVWSSDPPSRVEAEEPSDLLAQVAYTMANPVESGLVAFGSSWPGLRCSWPSKPRVFRRPKTFFRGKKKGGKWPEEATLVLHRPEGYEHLSDDELAAVVEAAIDEREAFFRAVHKKEKRPFLGRKAVLRQSRHDRPASKEPRFGISPKVSCRDKWLRKERLQRNKQWLVDYNASRKRFSAGERDVLFPAGTYQLRVLHGVKCARPPDE